MKILIKLCCLFVFFTAIAFGQASDARKQCPQQFQGTTSNGGKVTVSATPITITNDCGAVRLNFEEIVTGGPASMSAVLTGCMSAATTCTTLDTNTSTTSVMRKPTIDTVYNYFVLTPTWSGGTSPTFTVNTTSTIAASGGSTLTASSPIDITAGVVSCPTCGTGTGNVAGAASSTDSNVALFSGTTGKILKDLGLPMPAATSAPAHQFFNQYTQSTGAFSSAALASGDIPNNAANTSGTAANLSGTPTLPSGTVLPGYVAQTLTINTHALSANVTLSASDFTTGTLPHAQLPAFVSGDIPNNAANTSGLAGTATALASAPTNCSAGNAPRGIDASGNALNCTPFTSGTVYPGGGVAISTGSAWNTSKTAPSGAFVGTTDTQTLTNKDLTAATNLFSGPGGRQFTSGTTDSILTTDMGKFVVYSVGASNVTAPIIDVASSPVPSPVVPIRNFGTGTITINRTSASTINGGTSFVAPALSACTFHTTDNVNWLASCSPLFDVSGNFTANTTGTASNLSGTPTLPSGVVVPGYTPTSRTVNSHALSANVTVTQSDVGLSNVTNDAQTKASIVPNTTPSSGDVLIGTGTTYAKQQINGDASLSVAGLLQVLATHLTSALPGNQGGLGVSLASLGNGQLFNVNGTIVGTSAPVWDAHVFGTGTDGATKINSLVTSLTYCPALGCIIDTRGFSGAELTLNSNMFHGTNRPVVVLVSKPLIACVPQVGGQLGIAIIGVKASSFVDFQGTIRAGTSGECGGTAFPNATSPIVFTWAHGPGGLYPAGSYYAVLNECGNTTTDTPISTGDCFGDFVSNIQVNGNGLADFDYFSCCVEERGGIERVPFKGFLRAAMFFDRGSQIGPGSGGGSGPTHFEVHDIQATPDSSVDGGSGAVNTNNWPLYGIVFEGNSTYLEFTGQSGCSLTTTPTASGQPTAYTIVSSGVPGTPVLTNKGNCSTPPTGCTLHAAIGTGNVCGLTTGGSGANQNVASITWTAGSGYPTAQVPTGGIRLTKGTITGTSATNRVTTGILVEGTYDTSINDWHGEREACDVVQVGAGTAPTQGVNVKNIDQNTGAVDTTTCPNGAVAHAGLGFTDNSYVFESIMRVVGNGGTMMDDNRGPNGTLLSGTDTPTHQTVPFYTFGSTYEADTTLNTLNCGISGTTACSFKLFNTTSGSLSLTPPTGALGSLAYAFPTTGFVDLGAANAFGTGGTLNLSASTVANAFRLANIAGCTVTVSGGMCFDTTAGINHMRVNGADGLSVGRTAVSGAANTIQKSQNNTSATLVDSLLVDGGTNLVYTGTGGYRGIVSQQNVTVAIGSGTSIGNTQLCSTTNCPAGLYTIHGYIDITTACGTSGTYQVNLVNTDDVGSKTYVLQINGTGSVSSTGVLTTTSTANYGESVQVVRSTGAAAIQYNTTAVACGTAGPMVGNLYLSVTREQ